jgi:hypothetical protein
VPNEIVIEAMIKGLRPGPTTQYFARKPQQTLEKLLQKMDEYIRADIDFRQKREEAYRFSKMTRGFGGRLHPRHVWSIHNSNANDERASNAQHSHQNSQSSSMTSFRPPALRGRGGRSFSGGRFGNQPRKLYCLFVVRTRATQQGHAKSQFRSRRKLPKLRRGRVSRSRSSTLLRVTPHISQNMWPSTTYDFCCIDKPFPSFMAPLTTTTTTDPQPTARRAQSYSVTARSSGEIRSSHSQKHRA